MAKRSSPMNMKFGRANSLSLKSDVMECEPMQAMEMPVMAMVRSTSSINFGSMSMSFISRVNELTDFVMVHRWSSRL